MRRGRPTQTLQLTETEAQTLRAWIRRPTSAQGLVLRARIVMLCASGQSNTQTATELNVSLQTVGKWRQRFIEKRLDGLFDEPRPGTPRKLTGADVERVLGLTRDRATESGLNWSTRSLAEASGVSRASVHRIWRAFGLRTARQLSNAGYSPLPDKAT